MRSAKIYFLQTDRNDENENTLYYPWPLPGSFLGQFNLNLEMNPPEPYEGETIYFTTSGSGSYAVSSWSPAIWFPDQNATSSSITATQGGTVFVLGKDNYGCVDTGSITFKVRPLDRGVFLPNAFSPNGDGINDIFEPDFYMKRAYIVKSFNIFNRWGKSVYSAYNTPQVGWNGNVNNSSQYADLGTYNYFIEIQFIDGTRVIKKGSVTLIR